MKENPYDTEAFFTAYKEFPRSAQGLEAAGEWHELQKLLPDFSGKRVLDIGCGFGWHCIYAAEHGARQVVGTDISHKMLAVAMEKTHNPCVSYHRIAMENLDFAPQSFDVILSSLALHYTQDFSGVCEKVSRFLTPGGVFVFSVEHPVFTAHGAQQWVCNADGHKEHWPVDNYFLEGARDTEFLGSRVTKYHRTLTSYVSTLLEHHLNLGALVEPQPPAALLDSVPEMREETRRPMMLILAATKTEA